MPQPNGGWLRRGGTGAGGRPRSIIKARALAVTGESVEFLRRVRDAEEKVDYITQYGMVIPVKPRMQDRVKAAEVIAKIAGVEDDDSEKPTLIVKVVRE